MIRDYEMERIHPWSCVTMAIGAFVVVFALVVALVKWGI
jgi:hypothetical protein